MSEALALSVRRVASSAGSGAPALGGRELTRRARTIRPSSSSWPISASQAAWSASMRRSRPSRSWPARALASSSLAAGVGGHHDGAQVAEVELVDVGQGGVGPVAPLGGAETGEKPLGQGLQLGGVDLGAALGPGRGVLLLDGLADGRDATPQDLVGDGALVGLEGVEDGPAVVALGPQPLGTGLLVDRPTTGPIGALAPASAAALAARTPVTRAAGSTAGRAVGG